MAMDWSWFSKVLDRINIRVVVFAGALLSKPLRPKLTEVVQL
jgi:hypothetical protein